MPTTTHRRVGVVVRASASQSVDMGFISQVESYQKTFKNGIHSFPAWRSAYKRDSVENKPASLLVVSLGKALNGMPPSFTWQTDSGAKQSTRRGGPSLTEDMQTERERYRSVTYIYILLHRAHNK